MKLNNKKFYQLLLCGAILLGPTACSDFLDEQDPSNLQPDVFYTIPDHAEAAVAAAQEGKFYEMHEMLLKNRRHLGTISLNSYAKEVGIKNKSYLANLIDGKYGWTVQDDIRTGLDLGIKNAPAFFINGEKLEGHVTEKSLTEFINHAIRKRKVRNAA